MSVNAPSQQAPAYLTQAAVYPNPPGAYPSQQGPYPTPQGAAYPPPGTAYPPQGMAYPVQGRTYPVHQGVRYQPPLNQIANPGLTQQVKKKKEGFLKGLGSGGFTFW